MPSRSFRTRSILACALLVAASSLAQDRGATRTKYVAPIYPDDPEKKDPQGNVLLIGRIDSEGNV